MDALGFYKDSSLRARVHLSYIGFDRMAQIGTSLLIVSHRDNGGGNAAAWRREGDRIASIFIALDPLR